MRALSLDFRRQSRPGWIGRMLLVVSLAAAAVLALQYWQTVDAVAQTEADIRVRGVARRSQPVLARPAGDAEKTAREVKRAREVVFQLGMPWNELFESVESIDAPDVALLGIESDSDKQRVKITAEAKNLDAMLGYLRAIGERPVLAEVYLQSHQMQQQDPQHPVRFVLIATWRVGR